MARWDPWLAAESRAHIDLRIAPLPHRLRALYWPRGERAAIIISPRLAPTERRAALAHELVHDERGGGAAEPFTAKDERSVVAEVARRLVPPDELARFVERQQRLGGGVTALDVAEEFDTTPDVAAVALARLAAAKEHRRRLR